VNNIIIFIKERKFTLKKLTFLAVLLIAIALIYPFLRGIYLSCSPKMIVYHISFSPDCSILTTSPTPYFYSIEKGKVIYMFNHRIHGKLHYSRDGKYYAFIRPIFKPKSDGVTYETYNNVEVYESILHKKILSYRSDKVIFSQDSGDLILGKKRNQGTKAEILIWNIENKEFNNRIEFQKKKHWDFELITLKDSSGKSLFAYAEIGIFSNKRYRYLKHESGKIIISDINGNYHILSQAIRNDDFNIFASKDAIFVSGETGTRKIYFKEDRMEFICSEKIDAVSPDGKIAVSTKGIKIYHFDNPKNNISITGWSKTGSPYCKEFSPDGEVLGVASTYRFPFENGEIRLYDVNSGKLLKTFKPPKDYWGTFYRMICVLALKK